MQPWLNLNVAMKLIFFAPVLQYLTYRVGILYESYCSMPGRWRLVTMQNSRIRGSYTRLVYLVILCLLRGL